MSKKKKNKNKKYYEYEFGAKKDKKSKKSKKSAYGEPELKRVKPSLDKKEAKESKKILQQPVEVPKEFKKNRFKCNHAGTVITAAEFKAMTPTYAAYTPMLDTMIEVFGEENVGVCKSCYDVLVGTDCIRTADIDKAVAILYAAANTVVSHKRFKTDEIKEIAKVKDSLADWSGIAEQFNKLEEKGAFAGASESKASGSKELTSAELANLNKMSSGTPFSV